jgi:exo-1,4-beta-D-glucosaminidase
VSVDNLGSQSEDGLSVESKVYDVAGNVLDDQTADGVSVAPQGVARGLLHPAVPGAPSPPAPPQTYFVELLLKRGADVVDRNVYWLSTQPDEVNWAKTIGNPQATMSQFADLTQLNSLHTPTLQVSAHTTPEGDINDTAVTITNTSTTPTVAFFLRADVRRGSASGVPASGDNQVLPIMWSDNDVTLWPGESETLHATYRQDALAGASPVVSVYGWNAPTVDVPAGS